MAIITRAMARAIHHNSSNNLLKLPDEVLFQIYLQIGSIDAVWALMCTSRKLWNIFHVKQPVQIVETVLTNGLPDEIVGIIQAVWNVQSESAELMTLQTMREIDQAHHLSSLNRDVSAQFVRRFLALARKIHGMSHEILDYCLENLHNIKEKLWPFPMLFPELDQPSPYEYGRQRHRIDPIPLLQSANWEEELRMTKGLWLCEFHSSLMKARENGDPEVCAELCSIANHTELRLEEFFAEGWAGTFWTIYRALAAMRIRSRGICTPYYGRVQLPDTMPLKAPLRRGGLEQARRCCEASECAPSAPGRMRSEDLGRCMDPKTEGYRFLIAEDSGIAPVAASLYRLPACEYAHLGLLHWGYERMHSLGLTYRNDHRIARIWHARVYDYWLNLLPGWLIERWACIQLPEKWAQRDRQGWWKTG
ncbi:hypothetical protein V2A60_001538 [Cordyceps javanica]|uniref:F-box domain-containing protein n=1 Tax=Cordyceps javanica TaxID=43265 RepID=A0A545VFR6_9HYPO|nr:hypothetical protein IF1G_00391 [Cordyceps javanica]TQW11640.1 hypothetical protein IF2G_00371 [Cordyceps javanica]